MIYEEVGRRIRDARQALGLMQADLGRMLSRPRSHAAISDIERGKTKLDMEELADFARILGKPLDYFTATTPPKAATPSLIYRRSDHRSSPEQLRLGDTAIEAFKQLARERAKRNDAGDTE